MAQLWRTGELPTETAAPVCQSSATVTAAFELLVALCVGCVPNMKLLVNMLTDMFYSGMHQRDKIYFIINVSYTKSVTIFKVQEKI